MNLALDRLTRQLSNHAVGHTIDYHLMIPSTMPVAHELAAHSDIRSGAIVVAEEQTSGRGRLQRHWEAPYGQALLVSIILKPPLAVLPGQLPMLAGVATAQALETLAPSLQGQVGLKWPNDVLLGHSRQETNKVAGILLESSFQQGALLYTILGIGVNVNQTAADLPTVLPGAPRPTSLQLYAGQPFDRTDLLIALCQALSAWVTKPQSTQTLPSVWRNYLWTLGQQVNVRERYDGEPIFQGLAVEATSEGNLVVEDENGLRRVFVAGDVSVRTD